jgi:hypothetical protein
MLFGKIIDGINAVLGLIPPLIWAIALVALGVVWWSAESDLKATAASLETTKAALSQLTGKVAQQKVDAKARYDALLAERDALQKRIDQQRHEQEIKDAQHKKLIAAANARLHDLAARNDGRLRDPNAEGAGCGRSGGGAEGSAAAGPGSGAGDAAQAGGLLSVQLSGLLQRLEDEADAINRAYSFCRSDAMTVRGLPPLPDPSSAPAEDPAASAAHQ